GSPVPTGELARRRSEALGPALTDLTYRRPVHVVRGEGVWLFDADGNRLLDAYNNVPVVGHCHPRVTEAVVRQTRLLNTHARYLYEPLIELAERLVSLMPAASGLDTVMIVNSGSEASELAWRFATAATGADGAVVTEHAYHVVTLGKPMGNGYPVAAVITRREIADELAKQTSVFSTFGGNPVAAQAALAVLDVIEDERLVENAARVGERLIDSLARLDAGVV